MLTLAVVCLLTLEGNRVQVVENDLLLLLVNLLLLPQDDIPLPLDCRCLKLRVLQDIRDDINGLVDIFAESLCVVNGLLARGVRIEVSTKILNLELQSMLRSLSSS